MRAYQAYPSGQAGGYALDAAGQHFLSEHWQDGQCRIVLPEHASRSKPSPIGHCLSRRRRRR